MQREKYRELVVSAVMHREVVGELAADAEIQQEHDYEWMRHLRHYWELDVDQCQVTRGPRITRAPRVQ